MILENTLSSHSLGRVFGIEVRVTYLLYVLIGIMTLTTLPAGLGSALMTLLAFTLMALCVFLHEMGHSLAAIKEGVRVHAIYLHPLGGLARLTGSLPGPGAEIMVALAGPAVSLLLFALCSAPVHLFAIQSSLLSFIASLNLMLALFNLLPIFPMDGGRVLTAILVIKVGPVRAIPLAVKIAKIGVICLFGLGVLQLIASGGNSGFGLIIISIMLHVLGGQELSARQYIAGYSGGGASWSGPSSWDSPQRKPKAGWFGQKINNFKQGRAEAKAKEGSIFKAKVDNILRKVHADGMAALTNEERELLNEASRRSRR